MRRILATIGLILCSAGCSENYTHDESLAAKAALEFADVAFVQHDVEKSYLLLADKARAYVPLEKYKETVLSMHTNGYPTKVAAQGAGAVKGVKLVNVALRGDGPNGLRFDYSLSLVGTAQSGYRVTTFNGGGLPPLP